MNYVYHVRLRATLAKEDTGLPGDVKVELFLPAFVFREKVDHRSLKKNAAKAMEHFIACRDREGSYRTIETKSWDADFVHESQVEQLEPGQAPAWPGDIINGTAPAV